MSARNRMVAVYDRAMRGSHHRRYYGNSGYYNFGYWGEGATAQAEASQALVDQIAAALPKPGRILDVACGQGASTARLSQRFPPNDLTGINLSEAQIASARKRAPDCNFDVMSATELDFPDEHFDGVICVEAAFHFDTRDAFLAEAFRVLKPGGVLTVSDILFRDLPGWFLEFGQVPRANNLANIDAYRARWASTGFVDIETRDETAACLDGFRNNLAGWPKAERSAGRMKLDRWIASSVACRMIAGYFGFVCRRYLLASARKPG
ncbi:class I SAM-dependent methyltransferase [Oricola sp.]|uniref:class I SAM-dependent methyltransferase n=1 Tax=Oricola sp. TaxID=1979950 RepID=UPI003BA92299